MSALSPHPDEIWDPAKKRALFQRKYCIMPDYFQIDSNMAIIVDLARTDEKLIYSTLQIKK